MAQYRLKKNVPDIDVVDGPFAGRSYKAGELYAEIPPGEEAKFERIDREPEPAGEPGEKDKGGRRK